MELKITTPRNDENMEFDETSNRYVLTLEYAKAHFPNVFRDDQVLKQRLIKNSRKIYDFIHYRGYSGNRKVVDFLLNRTAEGRDFLLQALSTQMEADAQSGYNDLSQAPAVNVATGQVIDREVLANNQICVDAEQIIENSASWFGVPITYRARYPWRLFLLAGEGK